MNHHTILGIAAIALLGAACQWLAWRMRLPAILFLLLIGILIGPATGWLDPDALMGPLLFPFVSLSVAVILFEGSLTLRFKEIRGLEGVVRRFVTSGVLVTWMVATLAARLIAGLDWQLATLFGAIMVVTGPTVIMPMLRTVRPSARVAGILRWEGIVVDPIGALLAVLVLEFIVSAGSGHALSATLPIFLETIAAGAVVGLAAGYLLGEALRRDWLPVYLYNPITLAAVFCAFALADTLAEESGLLAVTVMGIYLGNRKGVPIEEILEFKESLSLLLVTVLFILLAARLDFAGLQTLGWGVVGVFLAIQFLARPLQVLYCTWGSTLQWGERALLSWIAPRGIVAAAVTALFALQLEQRGLRTGRAAGPAGLCRHHRHRGPAEPDRRAPGAGPERGRARAQGLSDDRRQPRRTGPGRGPEPGGDPGAAVRHPVGQRAPGAHGRDAGLLRQPPVGARGAFPGHQRTGPSAGAERRRPPQRPGVQPLRR